MKICDSWQEEHVLPSGTPVILRLLRPSDREELGAAYERLSHASRYLRFHGTGPKLTDALLDQLMDVDDHGKLAIVAATPTYDLKSERGLGIARFIVLDGEPDVAEAAVTVADDAQGQGIGRLLLAALAEAARERGIRAFRGMVLASNQPMRKLLADAEAVVREDDGEVLVFDIPLDAADADHDARRAHPLWRLFKAIAVYVASLRGAILAAVEPPKPPE